MTGGWLAFDMNVFPDGLNSLFFGLPTNGQIYVFTLVRPAVEDPVAPTLEPTTLFTLGVKLTGLGWWWWRRGGGT